MVPALLNQTLCAPPAVPVRKAVRIGHMPEVAMLQKQA